MAEVPIDKQLGYKLKLENVFIPEIKKIFASQANTFKTVVSQTDNFLFIQQNFTDQWKVVLENHYNRTQQKFKHVNFEELPEDFDEEVFLMLLLLWRQKQAAKQAVFLSMTDAKMRQEALIQTRVGFLQENKIPSGKEFALTATNNLRRKNKARVKNIAVTETQSAAEHTKYTEADQVIKKKPSIEEKKKILKGWDTRRDSAVRPQHAKAQGQIREINDFFDVWGDKLMYPGDESHGAQIKNLVRCRCFSIYGNLKNLLRRLKWRKK
jgi:hypothetical protein